MKISANRIKNSRFVNWLLGVANTNAGAKAIVSVLVWAFALIPVYLYLLVRWGVGPDGFWEELALIVVAVTVIGWLQGFLLFFAIVITLYILAADL
jgi:hypothetical protein